LQDLELLALLLLERGSCRTHDRRLDARRDYTEQGLNVTPLILYCSDQFENFSVKGISTMLMRYTPWKYQI